MQQAHLIISGYVQGVGYRQFVRKEATKLGIFGWVKNLPASRQGISNGRVEAVLQGEESVLEKMIQICKKGPFLSEVEDIEVTWEEIEIPFSEFFIDN